MAEEWVKNARGETRVALDAQAEVEVELGALKENHAKIAEQPKEVVRAKDSVEAGLKTTERQFEEVHKNLHYTLRSRSKLHICLGWRRPKPDLQRNSLL